MTAIVKELVAEFEKNTAGRLTTPMNTGADYFARTGEWVTVHFAHLAKKWMCCEINDIHQQDLQANMPNAEVVLADSFQVVGTKGSHDIVLADCPQGNFGEDGAYCEHFEFLPKLMPELADTAVLFFNVNLEPYHDDSHSANRPDNYGMTSFSSWVQRRNAFYGTNGNDRLSHEFVVKFYEDFFASHGFKLDHLEGALEPSNLPNHPPFISRQIALLTKI